MIAAERWETIAAGLTGCVREDWFCNTHDDLGNPAWEECRWAGTAKALQDAYNQGAVDGMKFAREAR